MKEEGGRKGFCRERRRRHRSALLCFYFLQLEGHASKQAVREGGRDGDGG